MANATFEGKTTTPAEPYAEIGYEPLGPGEEEFFYIGGGQYTRILGYFEGLPVVEVEYSASLNQQ